MLDVDIIITSFGSHCKYGLQFSLINLIKQTVAVSTALLLMFTNKCLPVKKRTNSGEFCARLKFSFFAFKSTDQRTTTWTD